MRNSEENKLLLVVVVDAHKQYTILAMIYGDKLTIFAFLLL